MPKIETGLRRTNVTGAGIRHRQTDLSQSGDNVSNNTFRNAATVRTSRWEDNRLETGPGKAEMFAIAGI